MEYWDVYDASRTKTGKTVRRAVDGLAPGEYHLSVHVVVINPQGELLIQRRADNKADWPGIWDIAAAAGNALAGESSGEAARRELFEELGLKIDLAGCAPRMSITLDNCFGDWYVVTARPELKNLRLQPDEVMDIRWATKETVLQMIDDGRMVDYYPGLIELLLADGHTGAMRSWRGRYR